MQHQRGDRRIALLASGGCLFVGDAETEMQIIPLQQFKSKSLRVTVTLSRIHFLFFTPLLIIEPLNSKDS